MNNDNSNKVQSILDRIHSHNSICSLCNKGFVIERFRAGLPCHCDIGTQLWFNYIKARSPSVLARYVPTT